MPKPKRLPDAAQPRLFWEVRVDLAERSQLPHLSRLLDESLPGLGIESGLHQRLDVSDNDDRCRVQSDQGRLILGLDRRMANSLFMEWA